MRDKLLQVNPDATSFETLRIPPDALMRTRWRLHVLRGGRCSCESTRKRVFLFNQLYQLIGLMNRAFEDIYLRGRKSSFFDVEHYPAMTFTSQRIEPLDQATGYYHIIGTRTIREVSHEVSLDAWNISSQAADDNLLQFRLTAVLDRRDWGLTWSRPIQKIADEINLELTTQFVPASSTV